MKRTKLTAWIMITILLSGIIPASAEEKAAPPEIQENEECYFDYLTFGVYEQDNNLENGPEPIEWFVLEVENGRALVVSRHALELMPYHNTIEWDTSLMWETWDIRAWLNGEFLETAFTAAEIARIPTVTVEAQLNSFSYNQGNDTRDKVFLLSYNEVPRYFGNGRTRTCRPTEYAIARYEAKTGRQWKQIVDDVWEEYTGTCSWWLRTPGDFPGSATISHHRGGLGFMSSYSFTFPYAAFGYPEPDYHHGVRPAMWIDLEP
ncbi:MAG: hypothetical protein E7335_08540 [Clostridiales bacterium]|nr:hypothetical protein [Clostridiales bacterium]